MLVVVCLKPAWRTDLPLRLDETAGQVRGEDALLAMGAGDRAALLSALDLKTQGGGEARLLAVSAGNRAVEEMLRLVLALGADQALRIRAGDEGEADRAESSDLSESGCGSTRHRAQIVALTLAGFLKSREPVLILCGERSGDTARECFGAFLAHALGAAFTHRANNIKQNGDGWKAVARLEGGYGREMALPSPAVVTIAARLEELPYPSWSAWMNSRQAEIPVSGPVMPALEIPGDTRLRIPIPRVKTYAVPSARITAEERILEMVQQEAEGGGILLEGIPLQQGARAIVNLLREQRYLGGD